MTSPVLSSAVLGTGFVLGAALLGALAVYLIERTAARRHHLASRPADPYAGAATLANRVLAGRTLADRIRTNPVLADPADVDRRPTGRAVGGRTFDDGTGADRVRVDRVRTNPPLGDRARGERVPGYRMVAGGEWFGRASVPVPPGAATVSVGPAGRS